jgi:Na+-driven multidrug efflux pump
MAGVPLLVRTLALRATLLVTTYAAARLGTVPLAAHTVVFTLWLFLALALDALAIAGQALTGRFLGAGDVAGARAATTRMTQWGVGGGVLLGLLLLAARGPLAPVFSPDPAVRRAMAAALVVAAVMQPLAGYVFVLDGVLIGAGDGRYLALTATLQLLVYLPLVAVVIALAPRGTAGLVWLWVAFAGGWMLARGIFLGRRARGTAWLVTGSTR